MHQSIHPSKRQRGARATTTRRDPRIAKTNAREPDVGLEPREVDGRVDHDVERGRAAREERAPPPAVVLRAELEVAEHATVSYSS